MSEELTLLPCPACGNRATVWIHDNQITYAAKCNSCGMSGPQTFIREVELSEMIDKSAEAWNALPRALVWTKEIPKEGGNYWWNCERASMNVPEMVNVTITDGRFHFYFHYSDGPCFHTCEKCQWSGPIPMPKEPTE